MSAKRKERDPVYAKRVWGRLRKLALQSDLYECQECRKSGKRVQARIVHHIVPVSERPDLAYELDNLESVCFKCHEQKHPEKQKKLHASKRAVYRETEPGEKGPLLSGVRVIKL